MWKFISVIVLAIGVSACTYNISMAHTEGEATDVVDDTSTPTSTITANIPINQKPVPSAATTSAPLAK